MKIAHLTSVHQRFDTRIFLKECRSLAAQGHEVSLVVADGLGGTEREGVRIFDAGRSAGRLERMLATSRRVVACGLEQDAEIFHLHDPELLPCAPALKRQGKMVIYDAHEDLPKQVLSKPYLPAGLRPGIAALANMVESRLSRHLDGIIAATPTIADRFRRMGTDCVDINNYPLIEELAPGAADWANKRSEVCYVGGLSAIRGIAELVRAAELLKTDTRISLAGSFSEEALESRVRCLPGWSRVNALGYLDRQGVRETLARSVAGIVTLHPTPNYALALPVKMFEYMAAGIPVIASSFPLWRQIVEGNNCGLCVDPLDPQQIATAIDLLVKYPEKAQRMGENGRKAVTARYNWGTEESKLLGFYENLMARRGRTRRP